jgi:hypothetical protein
MVEVAASYGEPPRPWRGTGGAAGAPVPLLPSWILSLTLLIRAPSRVGGDTVT